VATRLAPPSRPDDPRIRFSSAGLSGLWCFAEASTARGAPRTPSACRDTEIRPGKSRRSGRLLIKELEPSDGAFAWPDGDVGDRAEEGALLPRNGASCSRDVQGCCRRAPCTTTSPTRWRERPTRAKTDTRRPLQDHSAAQPAYHLYTNEAAQLHPPALRRRAAARSRFERAFGIQRRCCSPTSRRATSTRRPRSASCSCSTASTSAGHDGERGSHTTRWSMATESPRERAQRGGGIVRDEGLPGPVGRAGGETDEIGERSNASHMRTGFPFKEVFRSMSPQTPSRACPRSAPCSSTSRAPAVFIPVVEATKWRRTKGTCVAGARRRRHDRPVRRRQTALGTLERRRAPHCKRMSSYQAAGFDREEAEPAGMR